MSTQQSSEATTTMRTSRPLPQRAQAKVVALGVGSFVFVSLLVLLVALIRVPVVTQCSRMSTLSSYMVGDLAKGASGPVLPTALSGDATRDRDLLVKSLKASAQQISDASALANVISSSSNEQDSTLLNAWSNSVLPLVDMNESAVAALESLSSPSEEQVQAVRDQYQQQVASTFAVVLDVTPVLTRSQNRCVHPWW